MRHILCILLVCVMTSSCASFKKNKSENKKALLYLKLGTSHLAKGQYPEALRALLKAEELDPTNAIIQNNIGLALYVRNEYIEAEKHMRRAIQLKPDFTEARNNLGRTLTVQGLYRKAIKELKIAVDDLTFTYPGKSLANLGIAYFLNGEYKKAQKKLKASLKVKRSSCRNFTYYGRTFYELKDYKNAALTLDLAVNMCKKGGKQEPQYYGAISYFRIGKIEEARARLNEIEGAGGINQYYVIRAKEALTLIR